jgi:lipoprotein NlpI
MDGALADSEAAIAGGMRQAAMFSIRGRRCAARETMRAPSPSTTWLSSSIRALGGVRSRGRLHFYAGRFDAAESDFTAAIARRPDAFGSIWLSMSRVRRGLDGKPALEQALERLKDGDWPAPVMQYLMGRLDREALMAAAARGDDKKKKGQLCEVRFYVAANLIAAGQGGAARPLLEQARDECPTDYIEYEAALAELPRLK